MIPKYALLEIERRWKVDESRLPDLSQLPFAEIFDRYLSPNLRVRRVIRNGESVYKMTRKYEPMSSTVRPITNLYLSKEEYEILMQLSGMDRNKRRYELEGGALDLGDRVVFEREFSSEKEAEAYFPPSFASDET